jgi:hypothetical protein
VVVCLVADVVGSVESGTYPGSVRPGRRRSSRVMMLSPRRIATPFMGLAQGDAPPTTIEPANRVRCSAGPTRLPREGSSPRQLPANRPLATSATATPRPAYREAREQSVPWKNGFLLCASRPRVSRARALDRPRKTSCRCAMSLYWQRAHQPDDRLGGHRPCWTTKRAGQQGSISGSMRTPNVDGRQPGSEGIPERAHIASSAFASARHHRDSNRTDRGPLCVKAVVACSCAGDCGRCSPVSSSFLPAPASRSRAGLQLDSGSAPAGSALIRSRRRCERSLVAGGGFRVGGGPGVACPKCRCFGV